MKEGSNMKVNLGCGTKLIKDFVNVDMGTFTYQNGKKIEPDILCNLDDGLPFDDNSIDYIYADNVIEHLDDPEFFILECHRVLKVKGKFRLITPHFKCHSSYHALGHKYHFGEKMLEHIIPFGFEVEQSKIYNKFIPLPCKRIISSTYLLCNPTDIDFILKKVK